MKRLRALVPLDGSPLSEAVLPLVRSLGPAEVTLLRVLDPASPDGDAAGQRAGALRLRPDGETTWREG